VREVWLFGSRARGDHRRASDVDLAIRMIGAEPGARAADWMFGRDEWQKRLELPVERDLQFFDPEEVSERVGPAVKRDGILLYRK
jgi:predicted nucleotidyltransferase